LAIRSGQYRKINVAELYEGQFISYDPITDTLEYDINNKISDTVTHYIAYFKTVNGFDKYNVMSKDEIINHAKKFSKTYSSKYSPWVTNFESMAKKTVLKLLLSKFGILSIEMQIAQKADQAVIEEIDGDNIEVEYVDNNEKSESPIDVIEIVKEDEELTSENLF
jgi:recombination protein RecT